MTELGGDCCVASACLNKLSTMTILKKAVVDTKKKGIKLILDNANKRLIDELNPSGDTKDPISILSPAGTCENRV